MSRAEALQMASASELDLVEVSPTAEPPVVRIMDYGKFLFEQNKKAHSAKRKQKQIQVKEVKFRPGTGEADYQIKLRNLQRFLTEGDKAKVTLRFRGREMVHQDIGRKLLDRVATDLAGSGVIEQNPLMEGKQMIMVFAPKKKYRLPDSAGIGSRSPVAGDPLEHGVALRPGLEQQSRGDYVHAQVEDQQGGRQALSQDREGLQAVRLQTPPQPRSQGPQGQASRPLGRYEPGARDRRRSSRAAPPVSQVTPSENSNG
jgi:translation initiation factor IF-3